MGSQRNVLVLVLGLAAATAAVAESSGALRWRTGGASLGLQPAAAGPSVQCGPFSLACDASAVVPLYASRVAPRSISMQVGTTDRSALRLARSQGLSLAVVGKAGLFSDLGVYGRVGTMLGRGSGFAAMPGSDAGLTYGVGLTWDFSRSASAVLGFDSYDMRGAAGDTRDVRATSLGLQWRY
jgi:OmpA-OmpF porin, OOP family